MKKTLIYLAIIATGTIASCNNQGPDEPHKIDDIVVSENQVLQNFVQYTAIPQYQSLQTKAVVLNDAIAALNGNPTDANLETARQAWRDTRQAWEQCEGFLIGPVEDDNYDPNMDTWPVDHVQLDSLLASSNPLQISDIENLSTLSLRGFHPLEYILWGTDGNAHAADITPREKQYMVSLAMDIKNLTTNLYNSWTASNTNYPNQLVNAGNGSTRYTTRQEAFLAIAGAMSDICGEVGEGKMGEPFTARDSTLTESPFSHNSITDFRNNIIGAQNVYLCSYLTDQEYNSLSSIVKSKNISLDNTIRQQFTAAINSFSGITVTFEQAIYLQPTQVQHAMDAMATLKETLDGPLKTFIQTYIKD